MSFKATLIKGKTFNCGKYTFNASEPDRKSQIVEEEFALLLAKNEKFKIESIKESEIIKSEIKSEAIDTKEPNIFVLIDWIEEATGYGNIAKKLLNKYSGTIKYVQKGPEFKDNLDLKDVPHESYVIQLTTPNCFRDLSNVKKRIGFTMFETTKIPPDWPKICNKTCDLLIVPSEENKKVFKNCGVKVPIEVIPLWVDNTYKYYDRPKRKTFTFLFVGGVDDHNRKGWYELQKAFKQEFKNEKDVRLIFKCLFINIHNEMALQIMEDDRIKFVKGKLKNKELNKLYKKADCFVFPTHGEGFGLPPLEAMSTGLPTIVTDWMGCKEFVDNKICYPLKVDKLEEALYPDTYGDVGDWAYISTKELRKQMRHVYEHREEAKQKGKLAAKVVNKKFRFKNFTEALEETVGIEKYKKELALKEKKIVFIAHHISSSEGYGCLGHELMGKYPTTVLNVRDGLSCNDSLAISLEKIPSSSNVIQLSAGDLYKNYKGTYKKSIGFTMFETTKLSKHWPIIINKTCDILLVPAKEVKKVFENCGVNIPIHVVPLWVNNTYKYYSRPKRGVYTFLWMGRLDHFNRKGCFDAVEAFKKEFPTERDVRLIIKGSNTALTSEKSKELFNDPRIKLVNKVFDREGLYELMKSVDCFLFPTHGEGFGLPPLEAMATGLPTIVTDWMGCSEFAKDSVCYPIKVDKLEKANYPAPYGDIGKWAYIDINKVRRSIRHVYENQQEAREKGYKASQYVNKFFRFNNFDDNLKIALGFKEKTKIKVKEDNVSIIMAVKDNIEYLKQCVKSIYKYTKTKFELIIVDNDSNDKVKEFLKILKDRTKNVKIITNSRNMNFAYGYNQAIQIAKYDYMCMLDIDTIVTPNWLSRMLSCVNKNEDCGICCPSQSYLKDMIYAPFVRNENIDIVEDVVNFSKTLKNEFEERQIFKIYGFCHLVKREVFEDIGVYDWKRYYGLGANDTDLFWRATLKGYKLYWAKGAYVHHFHSKIKESLGIDAVKMVKKGHKVFGERQRYPENYFIENDVMLRDYEQNIGIIN